MPLLSLSDAFNEKASDVFSLVNIIIIIIEDKQKYIDRHTHRQIRYKYRLLDASTHRQTLV